MPRICHLTVLNPALHSRIFYKEARSQQAAGYEVTVIGQDPADAPYMRDGIRIVPAGRFSRFSRRRFFSSQYILPLAAAEQADIYQIHSPELLRVARELKSARPQVRIVYDMHEDYAANVRAGTHYPAWVRGPLLAWLWLVMRQFRRYGDGIILAEDCYEDVVDFPEERTAFVRNKFKPPDPATSAPDLQLPDRPYLLYTGTIAEEWGLDRSLALWERIREHREMDLVVAGHSHSHATIHRLERLAAEEHSNGKLQLMGGSDYLPYETILALIRNCWAGTALYDTAPHLREKIPTKFYEFMGCGKPLFFTQNQAWSRINWRHPFGIEVGPEFDGIKLEVAMDRIDAWAAAERKLPAEAWSWETEEAALLELMKKVLG